MYKHRQANCMEVKQEKRDNVKREGEKNERDE